MERPSKHNYNTKPITKRVKHVTNLKNAPKLFQLEVTEKIIPHIGSAYHSRIDPKKETIPVEPIGKPYPL